jgi:hypothetical protein
VQEEDQEGNRAHPLPAAQAVPHRSAAAGGGDDGHRTTGEQGAVRCGSNRHGKMVVVLLHAS